MLRNCDKRVFVYCFFKLRCLQLNGLFIYKCRFLVLEPVKKLRILKLSTRSDRRRYIIAFNRKRVALFLYINKQKLALTRVR
jgi:hypothetical protein